MPIEFACQNCGARLTAPDDRIGSMGECPKCKQPVPIAREKSEEAVQGPPGPRTPPHPVETPVIRTEAKRQTVGKQPPPRKSAAGWKFPNSVVGRGMLIVSGLWIIGLGWYSLQSDGPAVLMFQAFAWSSLPHYFLVMIVFLLFGIWQKKN